MAGMFDEDSFFTSAAVPVPETPGQRLVKAGVKGATLGFYPGQFQPEGALEIGAEIVGSLPTYAAASAVGAGPAAAALRGVGIAKAGYAAGSALSAGVLGAATEGGKAAISGEGNPLVEALKGAAIQAIPEYGVVKAAMRFTKGGRAIAAAEKGAKLPGAVAATKVDDAIKDVTTTPSPAAVDTATTVVPEVPPVPVNPNAPPVTLADLRAARGATVYREAATGPPVVAPAGPRTLRDIMKGMEPPLRDPAEGPTGFPTTPREFTASYGPKIDGEDHVSGLPTIETNPELIENARKLFRPGEQLSIAKVQTQLGLDDTAARSVVNALKTGVSKGRVTLDHFIDGPETLWAPSPVPSTAIRAELENRFTPEIIRTAEKMSQEEFTNYALQNRAVGEIINAGGGNSSMVWSATRMAKGIGTFETVGKTPRFTETFDETLGKKVLTPLDEQAGMFVDALKMSPSPRHLELQLGREQLEYFRTGQGTQFLNDIDVTTKNQPFLTSSILKQSDEAIERVFAEAPPINIIEPSIIKKTGAGKAVDDLRGEMAVNAGMTEKEIDDIFAAAERDVDTQLGALRESKPPKGQAPPHLMTPLTAKEKAMMDSIMKRCR